MLLWICQLTSRVSGQSVDMPGTTLAESVPLESQRSPGPVSTVPPLEYFGTEQLPNSLVIEEVTPFEPNADWGKQFESIKEDDERIKVLEPAEKVFVPKADLYELASGKFKVYRSDESMISFMPGGGDQFGWLSFESSNYLHRNEKSGPTANVNFHLLSGPRSIDLPARLYDFELGYQSRSSLSDLFSYEWSAMVGAYSDFEGSAREGVRFPAHAVGMFHPGPRADWVVGVDYLGRDDVKVLPVAGFCWHDPATPHLRYQMIFPRPRIDLTLSSEVRLYIAGLFGGGTWQIEFPDSSNDVLTYRDYKLVTGIEQMSDDGSLTSWELGWVFGRKIEFRGRPEELDMDDAFVLRLITRR